MAGKTSPRVLARVGFIFTGFASLFVGMGTWQALHQASCLETYLPVAAKVESASLEAISRKNGYSYAPRITYAYVVADQVYRSAQVQILERSSSRAWAAGLLCRYPVGSAVTAYRSPSDPAEAFLLRDTSLMPYGLMLFPLVQLVIGLALVLFGGFPTASKAGRAARLLVIAVVVWLVTGFAAVHYLLHFRPVQLGMGIGIGVIAVVDLGLLILWRRMVPAPAAADAQDRGNPYQTSS